MTEQENSKKVLIYFYYMSIMRQKDAADSSVYDIMDITKAFSEMLSYITAKDLKERKQDLVASQKVVWIDSFMELDAGNYNIIFKSAKYNHVRNEINTETMESLGTRKKQPDGDEEKTHLCIRMAQGQQRDRKSVV